TWFSRVIVYIMSFIRRIKREDKVYLGKVENVRINGKVVQRHIRYAGRAADGKTVVSASPYLVQFERRPIRVRSTSTSLATLRRKMLGSFNPHFTQGTMKWVLAVQVAPSMWICIGTVKSCGVP